MKVILIRIELDEYKDQFGIKHECYVIRERVELESTGESYKYMYSSECIINPIYKEVDGERYWRCMVPTDFGCPASWHRHEADDGMEINDETWLRERDTGDGQVRYWGRKPVVEFKS